MLMAMRTRLAVLALLLLIIVAHVGLWRSPDVPRDVALRLTAINALAWAVILLPAWGVSRWLKAREAESADRRADG